MLGMDSPQWKNKAQLRVLGLPTVASFTDPGEVVRSSSHEPAYNRMRHFGPSAPRSSNTRNRVKADPLLYSGKSTDFMDWRIRLNRLALHDHSLNAYTVEDAID